MRATLVSLLLCVGCAMPAEEVLQQRRREFSLALERLRTTPTSCSMKQVLIIFRRRPEEFGDYLATLPKAQRKARVAESLTEGYLVKGEAKPGWLYLEVRNGTIAFPVDEIDSRIYLVPEEP